MDGERERQRERDGGDEGSRKRRRTLEEGAEGEGSGCWETVGARLCGLKVSSI